MCWLTEDTKPDNRLTMGSREILSRSEGQDTVIIDVLPHPPTGEKELLSRTKSTLISRHLFFYVLATASALPGIF